MELRTMLILKGPRYDGVVGPAPSLITEKSLPLFKRIHVKDYLKGLFARKLEGKSYLDTMRIEEPHD
ncbi:unnamed protein product [Lupinus luteus]|uniref:Uncharacterized protein n=1 Tax=Lupinus luteus TaxID=3873 RepID=A0AAV1XXR0_LUPLU